jgi:hypothetical protein
MYKHNRYKRFEEVPEEFVPTMFPQKNDAVLKIRLPLWIKTELEKYNSSSYIRELIYKDFRRRGIRNPSEKVVYLTDEDLQLSKE